MRIEELQIPDIKLIFPKRFEDDRGFFSETYAAQTFADVGICDTFVQDNHSLSRDAGVLRGLHYQAPPHAQAKLLRVLRGRIYDVAVDLRTNSPTFGKSVDAEISASDWNQIYIPIGFAHGFVTLEPDTEVLYKVSAPYAPQSEGAIRWDDPELAIDWPSIPGGLTLSTKDQNAPSFDSYRTTPCF